MIIFSRSLQFYINVPFVCRDLLYYVFKLLIANINKNHYRYLTFYYHMFVMVFVLSVFNLLVTRLQFKQMILVYLIVREQ